MNALDRLRESSVVVADTGDFRSIQEFSPRDATTNPSLIVKALQKPDYQRLLAESVARAGASDTPGIVDDLLVRFGREILAIVPGRVSTEVDARLSFDTEGTVRRAHGLIERYGAAGVPTERVLIKVAATWEGICAARRLEAQGIRCNLTLMFSFAQAVACADAGVTLISPFVGRILDWYRKSTGRDFTAEDDPGVASVRRIYRYYKRHGYRTEVMGASFRNTGQILALAGCDLLTISPELLAQLAASDEPVPRRLQPGASDDADVRVTLDEPAFRFQLNEDAMATEKLAEGIRQFVADARRLDDLIAAEQQASR